jgi:hypothetical protein
MKRDIPKSKGPFAASRPTGLDAKTWRSLEHIREALHQSAHRTGRDRFYDYLAEVYQTYKGWKDRGISRRMARQLAECLNLPLRKGTTPIRTLIDATFPTLGTKQKSRWSRALDFAILARIKADDLATLFNSFSGIAGCARRAAKRKPKREVYRNDWI